ncbi:MAG: Tad domain-containing protein [Methylobacteriaceae bacterium]|nr:Tad domain-containing protein [Methylobacteriaceae bacterium]
MSQRFSVYTAFSRLRLSAFSRDAEGSVAVLFALIVLPVMLFVGAALDLSRTGPATVNLQTALDSAVLAGVKRPGEQVAVAQRQFAAATGDKPYQSVSATFTLNPDNTLTGVANATIKTAIMSLARVNSFSLAARSKAKPPQTPSVVAFQLTAGYGWYWKRVELFIHKPGDASDTVMASYTYQPTDMTGQAGRGTGTVSALFNLKGVMTAHAVMTPVNIGSAYDNIYLKMTVFSDGCGPSEAPNPNTPMAWNENDFQCVTSGTKINKKTVTKTASPAYYSTNDAATARNLFVGNPSVGLPANQVPNIFTLIPCGPPIQHAWEDTPFYDATSWSQQDIFFRVQATTCTTNTNYPSGSGAAQLIQ